MDKGEMFSSPLTHHPLLPVAGEGPGPGVTRTGELTLPLTSCSTQESRPCTSPGEHSRAGSGDGDTGELAPGRE